MSYRIFRPRLKFGRRFSTEGTAEKIITKETKTKDGASIIERINIVQKWSKMTKTQKIALSGYGLCIASSFILATYHDGRDELIATREKRKTGSKTTKNTEEEDWIAVRHGCGKNMGSNFFESVFFPFTWTANIVPKVVLFFNPDKD